MGDLWDAVTWQNLQAKPSGGVMGYADGGYAWPAEAWQAFQGRPSVVMSVTADEVYPAFDAEYGDATNEKVATAVANRAQDRLWSVIYSNQANLPNVTAALKGKGLAWRDASYWPAPGVYLHVADPSGNIVAGRWHPPVTPVAVQDIWAEGWDHSTTYGAYPAPPASEDDVTEQDKQDIIAGVLLGMRQLYVPNAGELYGRTVEACNESIRESNLAHPGQT